MEEKNKIYVFDKKEIGLILLLVICLTFSAFTIGVKWGRKISYNMQGITPQDSAKIELKSVVEEEVDHLRHVPAVKLSEKGSSTLDETYKQLKEEFSKLNHQVKDKKESKALGSASVHSEHVQLAEHTEHAKHAPQAGHATEKSAGETNVADAQAISSGHEHASQEHGAPDLAQHGHDHAIALDSHEPSLPPAIDAKSQHQHAAEGKESAVTRGPAAVATVELPHGAVQKMGQINGKFTIQLGSYQDQGDAFKFADGFKIRGYDPIVSEVRIEGKGIWYRVSLGSFQDLVDAKNYIKKEESLFHGQDYVITEVK